MKKLKINNPGYLLYKLPRLSKKRLGVLCLSCGWMRVSWSVHDFRTCPCPNETMVDGGNDYLRYGGKDMDLIQVVNVSPIKEKKNV